MKEFFALTAKTYSYLTDSDKLAKGTKRMHNETKT